MVQQLNGREVKDKIFKYLEEKGPELPVHIAKHIGMNSIFASAFLSEMANESIIRISDMKVGGSPLYYSPNKIALLENYINCLGGKEKEACLLLKEKKILEDSSQTPAIRVALRGLKDFAFPFKNDNQAFWRYFLISEEEVRTLLEEKPKVEEKTIETTPEEKEILVKAEKIIKHEEKRNEEIEKINQELEKKRKELEILEQEIKKKKHDKLPGKEKISKRLKPIRKEKPIDETFLNEIKETLNKKQAVLISIESFDKKQVIGKTKINNQEQLLVAFNKKQISESDIIKISKKAQAINMPYFILLRGEASKRTKEAIEAYKRLYSIERIE